MMHRREKVTPETVEIMKGWEHSGFAVGWERKIDRHDRKGLRGLLAYMEHAPVSLRRLTLRADGLVHYQGTKMHPRLGRDHQLLPALDFLARLVPHVALRYEVTIRSYGALSTTVRRRPGWVEKPPVGKPPPQAEPLHPLSPEGLPSPALPASRSAPPLPPGAVPVLEGQESGRLCIRRRSWARLLARVWGIDPRLCPSCGKAMQVIAAIASPTQDSVIEKMLRHLHLWDPPWKLKRPARGPPRTPPVSPSSPRPDCEPWPEWTDPPHLDFLDHPPGDDGES